MAKSIIQKRKECLICHQTNNLEEHHVFFGVAKRPLSEQDGLKVWLCPEHHRGNTGVHLNRQVDLSIKRLAQSKYEETHTREEFMARYHRNYLD